MAEQDRYGSHLGANPTHDKSHLSVPHPQGSGAEQDRFGGWFGGGKGPAAAKEAAEKVEKSVPRASGAEQDRYGGWFGGDKGSAAAHDVAGRLPQTSGAEQDRYNSWFGGNRGSAAAHDIAGRLPKTSGAEQDRYEGWFGGDRGSAAAHDISSRLPKTSGAEQDRYGRWFGGKEESVEQAVSDRLPRGSGAEQDRFGSHFSHPLSGTAVNATAVGLLQSAVLPSFRLHAGLSVVAYGVSRYVDRVDGKDWLWPSAQVANAWWSAAVFAQRARSHDGISFLSPTQTLETLSYPQVALLTGVSAWGLRLFYRVASRSLRRGEDDPRYIQAKRKHKYQNQTHSKSHSKSESKSSKSKSGKSGSKTGNNGNGTGDGDSDHDLEINKKFWDRVFFQEFLPEAAIQTLVTLPFTLPFRAPAESAAASPALSGGVAALVHGLAVFLFGAGFALEVLADAQLEAHSRTDKADSELVREGVWSIVRHPNYLGDALVHLSFPILLLGAGVLHPIALLGPAANYLFLRFVGGDRQTEASQERRYSSPAAEGNPAKLAQLKAYRRDKNSFWPAPSEAANRWTWIVFAAGAGAAVLEGAARWAFSL
ncbi:hypothetical protein SLS62_000260 [Diatrype stigma]|uniref:Uncharacterized protein n=1 Tax=Diatrype stigma TaxID=117547 RepID=A0AAN9V3T3_9PEZI